MKSFIFGGNILSDSEGKISYKECCQRHNKTIVKNVMFNSPYVTFAF